MKNEKIEKCEEYVRLDIVTYNSLLLDSIALKRENDKLETNLLARNKELEMEQDLTSNVTNKLKELLDNIVADIDSLYLGKLQTYDLQPNNLVDYLNKNYLDLIKEIKNIKD